jgi:fructoselysine-6-P-deglycase FrlB-like protein
MTDRVELLAAEIDGSADALDALFEDLARHERTGQVRAATRHAIPARVRFVGMGSSRFAAELPARRLREGGIDAQAELASGVDAATLDGSTLLVAISNSGSTPEVVAAVTAARAAGTPVLAVTNGRSSPLEIAALSVLPLGEEPEASGIATRSYRQTVALLGWLVDVLLDEPTEDRRAAVGATVELLLSRPSWATAAADALDGADLIHVVGGPDAQGTREQAALMCREVARIAALPMDAGDWLHVGLYTLWPGGRVVLFSGTPYDEAVVRTVRERHATLVAIGPPVEGADVHVPLPSGALAGPTMRAIVEPLVMESIALELWRRTDARDRP